jgi:hypothetical protein
VSNVIPRVGDYPSTLVSSEEKIKDEYGLQYAKALYYEWTGKNDTLSNRRRSRFQKARRYRNGNQDTNQYLDRMDLNGDKSWININKAILPIIPKFVDVIVDGMMGLEYEVKVEALDDTAVSDRNEFRKKLVGAISKRDFIKEYNQKNKLGQEDTPNPPEVDGHILETIEEAELYMSMTFKQAVEIAAEMGIKYVFELNKYEEIKRQLIEDIIVCDIAATRTNLDPYNGVVIRRVDPENLVFSYTTMPDFRNIKHAGEIVVKTIAQLKREYPDCGMTEADWEELSKSAGKSNNPDKWSKTEYYSANVNSYRYVYDSFQVTCLDFEFVTTDTIVYEKKQNKYGSFSTYKRKSDYETPKKSKYKREKITNQIKNVYGGLWVLGTEKFMFGYGKKKNMNRPNKNLADARLSFKIYAPNIYRQNNKSMVERIIPTADAIQLNHLKIQQMVAKARPSGLLIDIDGLTDISLDGGDEAWSPLELIKVYDQTGNMYYQSIDDNGDATKTPPMRELTNGISIQGIQSLITTYNFYVSQLRDVTGINEARDASQPSSEALVGVQKLALAASNNATKYIQNSWINITTGTAEIACTFIQDIVSYKKDFFKESIGGMNEKTIEAMKRIPLHSFAMFVEVEPNEEDRLMLEQNIQASIAAGELRIEDAIMIRGIKNMKLANQMLISRRKKYQREKMEIDRANMEFQSQQIQQQTLVASQAKAQEIQLETQSKLQIIAAETQAKAQLLKLETEQKAILSKQNYVQTFDIEELKAGVDMKLEREKEDRKDDRMREQKTAESELIDQRNKDSAPKDFTDPLNSLPDAG